VRLIPAVSAGKDEVFVILIIDDEAGIRDLLAKWFRSAGYEVIVAGNGVEALAQLGSCQDDLDLVISDLNMPMMDGREAIRRIRESQPDVRVICMTGYSDVELPPGVTQVAKPFSLTDMLAWAQQALAVWLE
jgi:two-component system, cell cycle sensor histidine kinase and response regulator CckA